MKARAFMGVVLCLTMSVVMAAAVGNVPPYINYQGILTDGAGVPLSGTYDLTFKIYNDSTGGAALWTELHTDVDVDDGLFNVILGKTTSFMDRLGIDEDPWMAVQVDSDPEIDPRTEIISVPFAFEAMQAGHADTVDWTHIRGMPAGFADGVDDVGTGNGWADDGPVVRLETSSDNVGIGTSLPTAKLDVAGTAEVDGFRMPSGAVDGYVMVSDIAGNGTWQSASSVSDGDWNIFMDDMCSAVPGNVGIGTTTPFAKLTVVDSVLNSIEIGGNYFGLHSQTDSVTAIVARATSAYAIDGYSETSVGVAGSSRDHYGVYGIGIYAPAVGVYGYSSGGTGVYGYSYDGVGIHASNIHGTGLYAHSTNSYSAYFDGGEIQINSTTNGPALDLYNSNFTTGGTMVNFQTNQAVGFGQDLLQIRSGEGSNDDMQFIECDRFTGFMYDIEFRVDGDGDVYADGSFTGPADFSEMVAVSSGAFSVEPGDVMVIDPSGDREIVQSSEPRSALVAGIYSTEPGFLGSEREWDKPAQDAEEVGTYSMKDMAAEFDEVPLAVVGIVPCKVSAENGAINAGDLLVTSSTPGHAMRDQDPKAGTIVAKAMQSLSSGTGVIKVLVTLQ